MRHPDLLAGGVRQAPDRLCVADPDDAFTFADVDQRSDRLASALLGCGLERGDRVALLAHNNARHLELQIATQRAGLVLVPLNWRLAVPELRAVVADCAPALLVHGPGFGEVAGALGLPRVWHLGDDGVGESYEDVFAEERPGSRAPIDPSALAMLLYTSGTTGSPKGVMVSNRAHLARMASLAMRLRLTPAEVFLQAMPMFHLAGTFTHAFAYMGGTNVILPAFDPAAVLASIERHQVTHTLLVPTALAALLDAADADTSDLSSMRAILYGGSPIDAPLLRRALARFDCAFHQMYGLTETGAATLLSPEDHDPDARPHLLASAGTQMPLLSLEVVDEAGQPCEVEATGEIVVSGPGVADGYWQDPTVTAEAMREGWFHSGDVGRIAKSGHLYVSDRLKDIIITGGENVSAREVEIALAEHPDVRECAVVGLPDSTYGQRVHAIVVSASAGPADPADLDAHCRERLAGYKRPRTYELVDELPRNAMGKILKHLLRVEEPA